MHLGGANSRLRQIQVDEEWDMIAQGRPSVLSADGNVNQMALPSLGNEAVVDVVGLASGCAVKVGRPPLATGCLSCVYMVGADETEVIQQANPLEMRVAEARVAVEIAEDNGGCGPDEGGVCR
jgi:hypothetical protein